jgi:hypothetical protein
MANAWLDELEEELGTVKKKIPEKKTPNAHRPVVRQTYSTKKEQSFVLPLFLLVLLLAVGLVGTYLLREGYFRFRGFSNPSYNNYSYQDYDYQRQQRYQEYDRYDDRYDDRVKWNTEIITLISIINNHNLAVSQNGYPKSHYIYINEDWTIDRLPDHVYLDSQSRAFLEKFLRRR